VEDTKAAEEQARLAAAADAGRAEAALRESEGRHRFLAELAAATQPLTDPREVMATSARLLTEHLDVDRCAYAEVEDEAVFVITGDHTRGVGSIVGRWPVAAFGPEVERLMLANEAYVMDDVEADPRAGADLAAYHATEIRAVICVPLHKEGRFTAAMAVHQKTPRHWTPAEVALVRTVVARCWEALERARVLRTQLESEARYRAIVEASRARLDYAVRLSGIGFWYCDLPFDDLSWDERVKEHFWFPPDTRVTIEMFYDRIHPEDREPTRQAIDGSIRDRRPYDVDYRTVDPATGAVKWVRALGGTAYAPDGTPIRFDGVTLDVTAQKVDAERLARLYGELRDQDRRKDEFLATLAHELRNPLAPLRNGLQVVRLSEDRAVRERAQEMMDRQLGHMVRLIDDLLDVSRISRNKMELRRSRVRLSDVLGSAVETARPVIDAAGHHLELALPADPVVLDADLTRLAQVFSNLLTNSAKYTPPGGRIRMSAESRDGTVTIEIRDTGIGIPAAALPTLFDLFSQVDRSIERTTGGLGIGLALVKGLVEMHGGVVTAESEGPGRGSTFSVQLPVADQPAEAAAGTPADAGRWKRPGRRVLVVDDNRDSAVSMATLLELLGDEVRTAHDGLAAVETAEAFRPDVVLMDLGMPRLNGYEATRRIRQRPWGKEIAVIALTGWGQEADRIRSREAGCDGHLVKPVSLADLEKLLAEVHPGGARQTAAPAAPAD
jgi:signal transduction histidine kinase/ActR/RegA family two-component response regulator